MRKKPRRQHWKILTTLGVSALALALISVVLFEGWLQQVELLGDGIPKFGISDDYLIAIIWAIALMASIFFWPIKKNERVVLIILWFTRCMVTLLFMLFYEKHYGSLDSFGYLMRGALDGGPINFIPGGGTKNLDMIVQLLNEWLPVFSSYHALKVIFSMFGLIGVFVSYRAVELATGIKNINILWFFGLFPSILFWSSILGKDPIYFLGVSIFLFGIVGWYKGLGSKSLLIILAGIFICSIVRIWAAPILILPFLITELCLKWRPSPRALLKTIILLVGLFFIVRSLSTQIDSLFIRVVADNIRLLNKISRSWGLASQLQGSGQELPEFQGISDMILFLPYGIFTALFRPLPGEVNNIFGLLAGLENIFILGFLGLSLFKINYKRVKDPIVLVCILAIFFWSLIYAFISSQNLGSGFRFRLQIVSILFLLIFLLKHSDRSHVSTPTLKKILK